MLHWHAPCRPQLAIKARVVCFRASAQRGVKGCQRGQKGVQKCNQTHAPANFDWAWQQQRACVCVCTAAGGRWQPYTMLAEMLWSAKAETKTPGNPVYTHSGWQRSGANKSKSKLSFRARPRSVRPPQPRLFLSYASSTVIVVTLCAAELPNSSISAFSINIQIAIRHLLGKTHSLCLPTPVQLVTTYPYTNIYISYIYIYIYK